MNKKIVVLLCGVMLTALSAMAYVFSFCDFSGKVGTYPVQGNIELNNYGEVWGEYGYVKNGKRPKAFLTLSGEFETVGNAKYRIWMSESSKGSVSGTWDVVYDERKGTITGTMYTHGKTYKVNLNRVRR